MVFTKSCLIPMVFLQYDVSLVYAKLDLGKVRRVGRMFDDSEPASAFLGGQKRVPLMDEKDGAADDGGEFHTLVC